MLSRETDRNAFCYPLVIVVSASASAGGGRYPRPGVPMLTLTLTRGTCLVGTPWKPL